MQIPFTSIDQAIAAIAVDIERGREALAEDQLPDYPAAVALRSAQRAIGALAALVNEIGDLEYEPALHVYGILRRELVVS
jgi:hypothetical protein